MPFKKGNKPVAHRKKGSPNKTTTILKEAIMLAAELEGWDGHGTDGLTGYLRRAARDEMRAFLPLLAKVLPYTIAAEREQQVEVVYRSVEEIRREMLSRGIDAELMYRIMNQPGGLIDGTTETEGNGHDTVEVQPDG